MSDMRKKQPDKKTLDLSKSRTHDAYYAVLETWTYSSIKNEDVFPRLLSIKIDATDFQQAVYFADCIADVIAAVHDVHKSTVRLVASERFYQVPA